MWPTAPHVTGGRPEFGTRPGSECTANGRGWSPTQPRRQRAAPAPVALQPAALRPARRPQGRAAARSIVSEPPGQVTVTRQQPGDGRRTDDGPVTPGSTKDIAGPVPS